MAETIKEKMNNGDTPSLKLLKVSDTDGSSGYRIEIDGVHYNAKNLKSLLKFIAEQLDLADQVIP